MEDLSEVFRSSIFVFVGKVLGRLSKLAGQILAARLLIPATFGEIALAYTIIFLLSRLYSDGFGAGITRKLSIEEMDARKGEIFRTGAFVIIGIGILFTVLISVFKSDISNVFHQNNMPSLLMVFSPILILYPISQSCKAIFQSQGKTAPFVISHHVLPGLGSLFVFITLSSILNPYLATISYWLSFSLLQTVLYSSYLLKEGYIAQFLWPLKINTSVLLDLWEFSWPLIISSSVVVLLSNTDLIMIGYFLSTDEVGLYKAIQPFRGVVIFVLASFTYSLFPLMSAYIEDDQENKLSDIYRTSTKWITLTTLPIVATIGFFSEGIIMVFLTNSYQDAALVLSVLVFGMFLRAMAGPTGTLISAAALTKVEMYASFIGVIINILLNLILIPTIGLIGAAIATVTSYTMYNIFELYFVYHILGHWPIPKDVIKPTLIISVFSGFILYVVESLSISYNISNIVLISAIVGSCALFTIYITQSITESDRKALRELMP